MYSGKTQKGRDRLVEAFTEDLFIILYVTKEAVIVVFTEAPHGNWYAFGVRM
jgi:4-oxalocrotonate tautomerase